MIEGVKLGGVYLITVVLYAARGELSANPAETPAGLHFRVRIAESLINSASLLKANVSICSRNQVIECKHWMLTCCDSILISIYVHLYSV